MVELIVFLTIMVGFIYVIGSIIEWFKSSPSDRGRNQERRWKNNQ